MKKKNSSLRLALEGIPKRGSTLEERIRQRAYEIYQACGCVSGRELDDWLLAEKELNAELELLFRVERELKGDLEE